MIELEWHVHTLERRGLTLDEMGPDDRLAVLTHYYKRHARDVDGTTSEPATARDLIATMAATRTKRKSATDDATAAGVERLSRLRDEAAARRGA